VFPAELGYDLPDNNGTGTKNGQHLRHLERAHKVMVRIVSKTSMADPANRLALGKNRSLGDRTQT
jgi:hypothetical protein